MAQQPRVCATDPDKYKGVQISLTVQPGVSFTLEELNAALGGFRTVLRRHLLRKHRGQWIVRDGYLPSSLSYTELAGCEFRLRIHHHAQPLQPREFAELTKEFGELILWQLWKVR